MQVVVSLNNVFGKAFKVYCIFLFFFVNKLFELYFLYQERVKMTHTRYCVNIFESISENICLKFSQVWKTVGNYFTNYNSFKSFIAIVTPLAQKVIQVKTIKEIWIDLNEVPRIFGSPWRFKFGLIVNYNHST